MSSVDCLQDIFSLGCVIAEMFLDGRSLLDLGSLLAYRRGEWDPAPVLMAGGVPDDIADLVLHMIQRLPGE
jgi:phosphoinositide-3-kinase regulatory subunit 4